MSLLAYRRTNGSAIVSAILDESKVRNRSLSPRRVVVH